jgi:DNA polymerase III subunit delta'
VSLLPWQEALAARAERAAADDRLAHALLVCGPEGWGESMFGNWLALRLLEVDAGREAATLAHPDLRWIQPEGTVIRIDAVRELEAFCHGTAQAGRRKVGVIEQAHYLNHNAANALLKTLEEPPPGTFVVLVTAHAGRLIPTIRSRCQPLQIRPDATLARRWLETVTAADDLEQRLFEHGGAPVAVVAGVHGGEVPLAGVLERALEPGGAAEAVTVLLEQGLIGALGRWYRYVLALAAGSQPQAPPGVTLGARLQGASGRDLAEFADELIWVRRMLVTANGTDARLQTERLVTRWRHLLRPGNRSRTSR